ncbi:MAG TPA: hypothetical protein VM243_06340 [Phycisphaerae bacterium]|nr:hypothetical protein [Phycisphaerae bacterium]
MKIIFEADEPIVLPDDGTWLVKKEPDGRTVAERIDDDQAVKRISEFIPREKV